MPRVGRPEGFGRAGKVNMSTTRIIVVRHGQTTCNVNDIWHGWDHCELTETGREQARAVGKRLQSEPIGAIYSSDSRRAQETAAAIAAPHQLLPIVDPGLRERRAGEFEGVPTSEVVGRHPTVWQDRDADYWGWHPPGGETFRQVLDRALQVVDRARREHPGETVVLATHMGVARVLISRLGTIPLADTYRNPFPSTGVTIFAFDDNGGVRAEVINEAGHIE